MVELIHSGAPNIVCTQPFACLPNHVVGKGVIKEIRQAFPDANIVAIDYDPGASEVNQINRIKLMLSAAEKNMNKQLFFYCLESNANKKKPCSGIDKSCLCL